MRTEFRFAAFATLSLLSVLAILVVLARPIRAEQPECTRDRHLDECGQLCPTPETTTTTIQGQVSACPSCPLPAPCPGVKCENGDVVQVDRCPSMFVPCNRHEKFKPGDMALPDGTFAHCARKGAPNRVLIEELTLPYPVQLKK
jgi:hypothetical protein